MHVLGGERPKGSRPSCQFGLNLSVTVVKAMNPSTEFCVALGVIPASRCPYLPRYDLSQAVRTSVVALLDEFYGLEKARIRDPSTRVCKLPYFLSRKSLKAK